MTCQVCLSACERCRWGITAHILEHPMTLSGATWHCREGHRIDADPVHVMTANGAPRMF